jgi:phytoene dehydrogenase-like protein
MNPFLEKMTEPVNEVDVAIIGAGFAGLGVGIALKKRQLENFVIFEGEEDVGGSWRTNTYPGCACDVPSHLYSYSFEPNPDWPEAYSKQADIRKYIEHCADKYEYVAMFTKRLLKKGAKYFDVKEKVQNDLHASTRCAPGGRGNAGGRRLPARERAFTEERVAGQSLARWPLTLERILGCNRSHGATPRTALPAPQAR